VNLTEEVTDSELKIDRGSLRGTSLPRNETDQKPPGQQADLGREKKIAIHREYTSCLNMRLGALGSMKAIGVGVSGTTRQVPGGGINMFPTHEVPGEGDRPSDAHLQMRDNGKPSIYWNEIGSEWRHQLLHVHGVDREGLLEKRDAGGPQLPEQFCLMGAYTLHEIFFPE
jgi:hypothetical protein